jgi:ketosteroid isomerase-like protein
MRLLVMLSCVVACALLAVVVCRAAEEPSAIQRELMKLEDGAMERWRQGDPMGWAEIAAPEVIYVDAMSTKPVVGLEAYSRFLEALKGQIHYQGSEYTRPKAVVYGDVALLTYNYQATDREADGAVKRYPAWNTTEVYARLGGAWKIIHTHWSYLRHVAPDSVEVPVPVKRVVDKDASVLAELMRLEAAAMERYRKGDPFGFTEISIPAVTYFDSRTPGRVEGLASLKAEMAARAGKIHYDVMDFVEPRVLVHGDAAVLFYRFLSTSLRPDGAVAERTAWNCTEVFAKSEGQWRIVHTHWSLIGGQPEQGTPSGF